MKTLLVSVDFSSATRAVVDTAVELAKASDAQVILHHSLLPPIVTTEFGIAAEMVQETIEIAEKGARHQLQHLEDELTAKGLEVTSLLTAGPAAGQILEQAARKKADLIVLGSHGHTALYDLIVGGTTHAVLRKAGCPVLVVPRRSVKNAKRKKR
jgi:Universal stress protein UspA and related nucleotide-binding proteins